MRLSVLPLTLNTLLMVMEASTAAYLTGGLFERKRHKAVFYLLLCALILLSVLNLYLADDIPLVRTAVSAALYGVWIFLCCGCPADRCLVLSALLVIAQRTTEIYVLIPVYLLGAVSGPYVYYSGCYTAKLFVLVAAAVFRTRAKNKSLHKTMSVLDWLRVLFFPASAAGMAFYLTAALGQVPGAAEKMLVCVLLLTAIAVASMFFLDRLEYRQDAVLENTVLRQNLKVQKEHISSLQKSYASQRRQTHDFNNILAVLRDMADRRAPMEEFSEYLGRVLEMEMPAVMYFNTGRIVVDIILGSRYDAAKSKGIHFDLVLEDLSEFPLPDDALVVVLTNLIDNAIEACGKIPLSARRWILLKMYRDEKGAVLYIENTTAEPVKIRNNRVETTKEDAMEHGFGLKNIGATLEQNGGAYAITYRKREGTFCFSAAISENCQTIRRRTPPRTQ